MPRMSGRQLEQLSTDDLIEVILRQQEIQKILEPQQARIEHLEAPGAYLQHVQPISRDRLEKLMKQVFGLHLNQGAIANIIQCAAASLQPEVERIAQTIRASPVIGCDETGARVGGNNRWHWVFETPQSASICLPTVEAPHHRADTGRRLQKHYRKHRCSLFTFR